MPKAIRFPLLAVALIVVFAGTVLATGASGFHPTILSRGTLSEPVHYNTGAVKFQTKGSVDFVRATVTFDAPGSSGWHAHPGVVLVNVVSGSLVEYRADCSSTTYAAGSAFTESGDDAGLVRNESTETPAVASVTYIVPTGTPNSGLRIDKDNPGCPGLN
jgi:quercetin dioxygenase-like cupin family protein